MRLSDLQSFFDGKMSGRSLHEQILPEVQEYERRIFKKEDTIPITVVNDTEVIVSAKAVSSLCTAFLNSDLSTADLMYIADGLLLAKFGQNVAFVGDNIVDAIGALTDPEINGPITSDVVQEVLNRLRVGL
jgi:hypothetical protein